MSMSYHTPITLSLPRDIENDRANLDHETRVQIVSHFLVEHLITLVTPARRAPPSAKKSLNRVWKLHENSQLSLLRCRMVIQEDRSGRKITIFDDKTNELCELFKLDTVTSPIYRESNDPCEPFNNLLMFNVNADLSSKEGPFEHELHIFQCIDCPAHIVVESIVEYTSDNMCSGYDKTKINDSRASKADLVGSPLKSVVSESPPLRSTGGHLSNDYAAHPFRGTPHEGELQETNFPPVQESEVCQPLQQQQQQQQQPNLLMDNKHSRDKSLVDAEINLLNMCFDDIEYYLKQLTRIQRARSSISLLGPGYSDLSAPRKRTPRKKTKGLIKRKISKSSTGPSTPNISRTQSISSIHSEVSAKLSALDLMDLFEKVKFSIILLARLQGFVTEPNPPLLTHRLFTMLHSPLEYVRDLQTGRPELARGVVTPLFPEEAIRLIQDSLVEPELRLWRELGEAWTLQREKWKGPVTIYIPQFKSQFIPNPSDYHHSLFNYGDQNATTDNQLREYIELSQAIDNTYLELDHEDLRKMQVLHDYQAENQQEITLRKGEIVMVIDDTLSWCKVENEDGDQGFCPGTILGTLGEVT